LALHKRPAVQPLGNEYRRFRLTAVQDGERGKAQLTQRFGAGHDRQLPSREKLPASRKAGLNQITPGNHGPRH